MSNSLGAEPGYILYGTSACHLCELAEEIMLGLAREHAQLTFEKVDISDSDALFERYGLRIPVLRDGVGGELGWPFTAAEVREFAGL